MSGSLYHILGWRQNGCGKKGVLVTKGTDRGWLSIFSKKVSLGKGRNPLRRWKSANIGGRGKGS
ncbi:hypothetical protein K050079A111_25210 [Bilophila wadsworthia]